VVQESVQQSRGDDEISEHLASFRAGLPDGVFNVVQGFAETGSPKPLARYIL